jgi:activator of 2-hydroxyglutaryl-CoA dehydratase
MYDLLFMCAVFTTKPIKSTVLLGLAKEIIIINLRFRPRN